MTTTTVTIRMDADTKAGFERFCKAIGMPVSTAFNMFAKKTVRDNAIPFALALDEPNGTTMSAFEEIESGGGETFGSLDELKQDLYA